MLAQGFLDLFFDAAPHLEYFFQFFELRTKAAFAKAAFDTLLVFFRCLIESLLVNSRPIRVMRPVVVSLCSLLIL